MNSAELETLIETAIKHAPHAAMASSAELCASDARLFATRGDLRAAWNMALTSLRYSLGILSPVYDHYRCRTIVLNEQAAA
jgi:hypothetical protein